MEYRISLCTVCMNRLHHLQKTLPKNIEDNLHYPGIEFVLLDYNSQDGLEDWVKSDLMSYIKAGKLVYYKTTEPDYFRMSHSKNIAHRVATGDIVCNVDADNYAGKGFAEFIRDKFQRNPNVYLVPEESLLNGDCGAGGRICLKKTDFINLRGYDESFDGWGYEDIDLRDRLKDQNIKEAYIDKAGLLQHIEHGNQDRVRHEKMIGQIHSFFASRKGEQVEGIFLYSDGTFDRGAILRRDALREQGNNAEGPYLDLSGTLKNGSWKASDTGILLKYETGFAAEELPFFNNNPNMLIARSGDDARLFMKVTSKDQLADAVFAYNYAKNFAKFFAYRKHKERLVNPNGFGSISLRKNFGPKQQLSSCSHP